MSIESTTDSQPERPRRPLLPPERGFQIAVAGLVISVLGNIASSRDDLPGFLQPILSVCIVIASLAALVTVLFQLKLPSGYITLRRHRWRTQTVGDALEFLYAGVVQARGRWLGMALLLIATSAFFHRNMLSPVLPGLYPKESAVSVLDDYFASLNRLFTHSAADKRTEVFRRLHREVLAHNTSVKYLKRCSLEAGIWLDEYGATDQERYTRILASPDLLEKAAYMFSDGFGSISRVRVVDSPSPQHHLNLNIGIQRWFVLVQYDGEFIIDTLVEDLTIKQLATILTEKESELRDRFNQMVRDYYPTVDVEKGIDAFSQLEVHQMIYRDLPVQIAREGKMADALDETKLQNGVETVLYSIELHNINTPETATWLERLFTNGWRIEEIGVWGLKRQRGDRQSPRKRVW